MLHKSVQEVWGNNTPTPFLPLHFLQNTNMSMRDYYNSMRGLKMGSRAKGRAVAAEATRRARARGSATGTMTRVGYGSVARARGAAVQGEMKYFDTERTNTTLSACTTTWVAGTIQDPSSTINLGDVAVATPQCLFAPKVSASLNGRIGRKVKVLSIKIRGYIRAAQQAAQAAADPMSTIRLMLVLDKQTNATQMTGAQLLNDAGAAATTLNAYQNPNNFGRFKVLKQKMITLGNPGGFNDAATTGATNGVTKLFKMTYKFKVPLLVNFNATNGGTVADIIDNSFHILAGADDISMNPTIAYYCRVNYKE